MSKDESWPTPLRNGETDAGTALRQYEQATGAKDDESAAYSRVLAKVERKSHLRWTLAVAAVLALPGALWLVRARGVPSTAPSIARSLPGRGTSPPAVAPTIALGKQPTQLPTGVVHLVSNVTVVLSEGASAKARFEEGTLDIALLKGRIELHVPPREIGQAVLVTADRYRFTVVGTEFSIAYEAQQLELNVTEGLVAVSREADHLAAVARGERWSTRLPDTRSQSKPPVLQVARQTSRKECSEDAANQDRLACYRKKATKSGAEGERAQHALARYLRDDVVDLTAALSEFETQRSRFPRGELRTDADRAIIELLPRLGRHAEALVETQSFLDAQPDAEDRAEIRLLRGDIYRGIYGDAMSAEREYDEGAEADGRAGDDSRFLHALCLEALGRLDEARAAYQDYLALAGTAHEREARRRMEKLAR
jgi:ferric-dicitrate binding protein FerR (iron transport regulator)